jgi:hypothetical protein|tara:strand:- start:2633 stop:3010 length:378 start_codon:yes stop_codon:yes gene_type:complete
MLKVSFKDWYTIGTELYKNDPVKFIKNAESIGISKEAIGRIIFDPIGEPGFHEDEFNEIMKEKDLFHGPQEGGIEFTQGEEIDNKCGYEDELECQCEECQNHGSDNKSKERKTIHDILDKIMDIK